MSSKLSTHAKETQGVPFPVVGIGASAGGLEAFTQLLSHLPATTGMAFVLVQHLDPNHESQLRDLLSKSTSMNVAEATEGLKVEPNHIYTIPPNKNMRIHQGALRLTPREPGKASSHAIDDFLRSLAEERKAAAVGVILSGSGNDGALGLAEIKAEGGITFAQDEHSAKQTGMPRSAISSGAVDLVLAPAAIAAELSRIGQHKYLRAPTEGEGNGDEFQTILRLLRNGTGIDFSDYRDTTIRRRIVRRMAVHRKEHIADYIKLLEEDGEEISSLYRDVLINVTSFFRDPQLFEALKESVFPAIVKGKSPENAIRIWVAGCSTGQEAYSLAISLLEYLNNAPMRPPIQIFATDITNPENMEKARAGFYPDSIEAEVSPERLRRFFTREDGGYRIAKSIRDMCVFAKQNVAIDPPFSRMDIVSCRNLLIYLSGNLQQRVIPTFHYALNNPGFLVLGTSETIGRFTDLFQLVDRDSRIYSKTATVTRTYPYFAADLSAAQAAVGRPQQRPTTAVDLQREADRIVLGRYAPAGVLVNDQLDILQFRGRTAPYLESPSGEVDFNLLKMARENLFLALRSAVEEARQSGKTVRRDDIRLRNGEVGTEGGSVRSISIEVTPVHTPGTQQAGFLILFHEEPLEGGKKPVAAKRPPEAVDSTEAARNLDDARRELAATREYLQTIIEQHSAANEELKSANEEILSSNEELQSTNEELQTAKEELQSTNEELTTVNEELHGRNLELSQVNDDLVNLLSSMKIPIIILGTDLRIRRFTPAASKALGLIPTDMGRPMKVIRLPVEVPDLEQMVEDVIATVTIREREVSDNAGNWYLLRIHPYRTSDHRIDGAILAFLDITDIRTMQEELRESRDFSFAIVETISQPILILDAEFKVQTANRAYLEAFRTAPPDTLGRRIFELGNSIWDRPRLRELLAAILPSHSRFTELEITEDIPRVGRRTLLLNGRRLHKEGIPLILVSFDDVTDQREAERQRARLAEIEAASAAKDQFIAMLSHELRTPLTPVLLAASSLKARKDLPADVRAELETMCQDLGLEARLIDDLLDLTRISKGRLELDMRPLDLQVPLQQALRICRADLEARGLTINFECKAAHPWIVGDVARLQQVFWNLLRNAGKFTSSPGWVRIRCFNRDEAPQNGDEARKWLVVEVSDSGIGIPSDAMPQLFNAFVQNGAERSRQFGGLGLGLAIAKAIVDRHGGRIAAASDGTGLGSTFTVELRVNDGAEAALAELEIATDGANGPGKVPQQPLRILLVEDHNETRRLMTRVLGDSGHIVATASSVKAALALAERAQFDLVISDLGLPDGTGVELMSQLRQRAGLRGIAVTGYGMEEDLAKTHAAGFVCHLVKPIDVEQLKDAIAKASAPDQR